MTTGLPLHYQHRSSDKIWAVRIGRNAAGDEEIVVRIYGLARTILVQKRFRSERGSPRDSRTSAREVVAYLINYRVAEDKRVLDEEWAVPEPQDLVGKVLLAQESKEMVGDLVARISHINRVPELEVEQAAVPDSIPFEDLVQEPQLGISDYQRLIQGYNEVGNRGAETLAWLRLAKHLLNQVDPDFNLVHSYLIKASEAAMSTRHRSGVTAALVKLSFYLGEYESAANALLRYLEQPMAPEEVELLRPLVAQLIECFPNHFDLYQLAASFEDDPDLQSHIKLRGACAALACGEYAKAKELSSDQPLVAPLVDQRVHLEALLRLNQQEEHLKRLSDLTQFFRSGGRVRDEVDLLKDLLDRSGRPDPRVFRRLIEIVKRSGCYCEWASLHLRWINACSWNHSQREALGIALDFIEEAEQLAPDAQAGIEKILVVVRTRKNQIEKELKDLRSKSEKGSNSEDPLTGAWAPIRRPRPGRPRQQRAVQPAVQSLDFRPPRPWIPVDRL